MMCSRVPQNAAVNTTPALLSNDMITTQPAALLSNDMITMHASMLLYGDGRLMVNNVLLTAEYMEGLF